MGQSGRRQFVRCGDGWGVFKGRRDVRQHFSGRHKGDRRRYGPESYLPATSPNMCACPRFPFRFPFAISPAAELIAFQPSEQAYAEVARYKVADGFTYSYPVVAGNQIFIKDKNSVMLWTFD